MAGSSPTRATALASPLQQFAGWLRTVNCPVCRALRTIEVATLIASNGGSISIGAAVQRLRCHACGNAPDWVVWQMGSRARRGAFGR
jgi:hypothetical protein